MQWWIQGVHENVLPLPRWRCKIPSRKKMSGFNTGVLFYVCHVLRFLSYVKICYMKIIFPHLPIFIYLLVALQSSPLFVENDFPIIGNTIFPSPSHPLFWFISSYSLGLPFPKKSLEEKLTTTAKKRTLLLLRVAHAQVHFESYHAIHSTQQ